MEITCERETRYMYTCLFFYLIYKLSLLKTWVTLNFRQEIMTSNHSIDKPS